MSWADTSGTSEVRMTKASPASYGSPPILSPAQSEEHFFPRPDMRFVRSKSDECSLMRLYAIHVACAWTRASFGRVTGCACRHVR